MMFDNQSICIWFFLRNLDREQRVIAPQRFGIYDVAMAI
jgi:hypothetical protein